VYQAHRILLWDGHVEEARQWADVVRASEFPVDSIRLLSLRQACAENDIAAAKILFDQLVNIDNPDISISHIATQIMSRPDEAHQRLVDANLGIQALASFLNYPYFDHNYFPELAAILEQQSIDRPIISGPPYACKPDQS
jgi:hypothetical protein